MRKRVLAGILAVIMAGSIMTGCAGTKKTENKSSVSGENKINRLLKRLSLLFGQEKKIGIISKRFQKIL